MMQRTPLKKLFLMCPFSLGLLLSPLTGNEGGSVNEIPSAKDRVIEVDGQVKILPRYSTDGVANPWPKGYEADFQKRVADALPLYKGKASVNTTGEREKYDYPMTVGAWLAGDRDKAIEVLQMEDVDRGDHAWTDGIDLYWGFTLKAQALKFFYLEDQLTPAYRDRMLKAFETWTETDPRPTLEYVLNLQSEDPEVAAYALKQLNLMYREKGELKAMAAQAIKEGHPNKVRFGDYMNSILDRWPERPKNEKAWVDWWALITAGDWMIFEEYERRTNPYPHPKFGIGSGPVGATWHPGVRGMRADARNTDNLRGMREVAIYLIAERGGNDLLRKLYKDRLLRTALGFWSVGNGEWDSPGYHPHTICAYLNLYAFARDQEVRKTAKAILDFCFTAAAVKHWKGSWGGPNKRDYGNYAPMRSVNELLYLYFGETPIVPKKHIADNVWAIVSGYRPPAALVAFAKNHFEMPLEMFNTHPTYSNWLPGQAEKIEFYETLYYSEDFFLGSLAKGSRGDVSGFRLTTTNAKQGADVLLGASGGTKRLHNGTGQDRIGQYQNLAILLAPGKVVHKKKGPQPNAAHFVIPQGAAVEHQGGIAFVQTEKAWIAFTPVSGSAFVEGKRKASKKTPGIRFLTTTSPGDRPFGYALEVSDGSKHKDYSAFKKAVVDGSKLSLHENGATLRASDGRTLKVTRQGGGRPLVERDGVAHDWNQHTAVYRSVGSDTLVLERDSLQLKVNAGGHSFEGNLKEDGTYVWSEKIAKD